MKPLALLTTSIVLSTCVALAVGTPPPTGMSLPALRGASPPAGDMAPLIVHEWGTFTSFSGSDGVKLAFRPLVGQDLPKFVGGHPFGKPQSLIPLFTKPSLRAIQRMETPVTYFYTPVERDVSVRVEFPEGLLSEYYPPVRRLAPTREPSYVWNTDPLAAPEEQTPLEGGMLDWGPVHLIPTSALRPGVADEELAGRLGRHIEQAMLEPADGFPHYEHARETDSAIVQSRFLPSNESGRLAGDYFEKFLFYRGLGNFELPLTFSETAEGTFELANTGDEEIRSLLLISVQGEAVRFRKYDRSAPDSRMTLQMPEEVSTIKQLGAAMVDALQAEGLYEKEARAMVNCWRSSWFGEEGTRLLYMVPGPITDELLPLHVEPRPDEVVRVLVGRMEIMPTSQEQQILELVTQSALARQKVSEDRKGTFRSPVLKQLQSMGRLAEPALVRVQQIAEDKPLRHEAQRLISKLRDTR